MSDTIRVKNEKGMKRRKKLEKEETAPTESTQEVYFLVEQTSSKLVWVGVYGGNGEQRSEKERKIKSPFSPGSLREGPGDIQDSSK